jgi:hypothetical protein
MHVLPAITLPLLLAGGISAVASSAVLNLHHRFLSFPVQAHEPEWRCLGSASIDAEMTASTLEGAGGSKLEASGVEGGIDNGKGWYQVGVERDGEWIMASTRTVRPTITAEHTGIIYTRAEHSVSPRLIASRSHPSHDRRISQLDLPPASSSEV